MSDKEFRINLSAELAKKLFYKHPFEPHPVNNALCERCNKECQNEAHKWPHYCEDAAAALGVLKKCIEKLPFDSSDPDDTQTFSITLRRGYGRNGGFAARKLSMNMESYCADEIGEGQSLELTICLLAKELFSK
jgi:hypothetical protein